MKITKRLIGKNGIRLLALLMAFSLGSSSLCLDTVYADEQTTLEFADKDPNVASSDGSKLQVYKDGVLYDAEVSTGGDWAENTVEGSYEPTLQALSIDEYNGDKESMTADSDLYTLTVSTGINPGTTVEYFAIRYTDENDAPQTKYIFTDDERAEMVQKYIGSSETNSAAHKALAAMGYTINERKKSTGYLSAWSIDELLFKTDTAIKTVNGIEVFMSGGKWTVQGMSVSRVTSIGDYGEYGFYSGKYFLSLGKQRMCELQSKKTGTQTFSADGDTLINIGGSSSIYFGLKQLNDKETAASSFDDLYTFRIDFSDVYDGGIESLLRNDTSVSDPAAGAVAEHLALEINYKDKNGWTRTVTMPVLLSVLGQYKLSGDTVRTIGLAQRGDTLAFTACLPEYSSLLTTKLYVGKTAREKLKTDGGIEPAGVNKSRDKLITALDSDAVRIAGISMYKGTCRMSNTADGTDLVTSKKLESYTYVFDFLEDKPILYDTTTSAAGIMINAGVSDSFNLKTYSNSNSPVVAASYEGNVLIRLKTDTAPGSDPSGTVRVRLTYQDTSGSEMSSPLYDVSDEVKDYLGYWPSEARAADNFGYRYGTSLGNVVEFPVQIADISAITNVELSLGANSDEWQVAGISIAILDNIGKRRIYAQELSAGTEKSSYRIVRSMTKTVIPPFPIDLKLLFTPGDDYAFSTGEGTIITSREPDYEEVRYSMSYEKTKENYGYAKTRKIYDVNVKVADDPDAGNINGDSGSSNHFYFQLRFKGGSSAYVLANQQLSSDGFRAGYDEMFSIRLNRDYGALTQIRIIPEDVSEDSNVFDKLNIEYITVTEQTNGGSATQYVFDNVGWIGIDYHDKSQDSAVKARAGRSALDIARKYNVSYQQKVINLLCEVTTLPWDSDYLQVEGSISCDLEYIDIDGEPRTMSFDVVSRMAAYMNKSPISFEGSASGSNAALYANMGTVSDPNWMLRPNLVDRFILPSLANVKSIKSMTLKGTSRNNKTGKWVIGGIMVSRIKSDSGIVTLNSKGEYYRSMQTIPLCEMEKSGGREYEELLLPAGEPQKLTVSFTENTITWAENSSWASSVSKFPESTNDELNVYIYPTASTGSIEDTTVGMAIQYTIEGSRVMQVKQSEMNVYGSGTSDAVFYYTGLAANGMQNLSSLSVQCRNSNVAFDHAIVQQVRDSVVVMTYTFNFGGSSAVLGFKAEPDSYTSVYEPKKQTLMLSFGADTKEMVLFGMSDNNLNPNDIAVCLSYRSTLGLNDNVYYSPYVYLTEVGISKIYPGMMAEVEFDVPYLSEITGYRIVSFGNISASVEAALATNESYSDVPADSETGERETVLDKVYSFNQTHTLSNTIREFKAVEGMEGENTVTPLDIYFKTADAEEGGESGINSPVEAVFYFKDHMGDGKQYTIPDIRQFIQSEDKQFKTGESTLVRMFMPDCKELTGIKLTPYEGSWKIDSISGTYKLGKEPINRKVNAEFTSEGQTISLKNVTLSTTVTAGGKYKGRVSDHEMNIMVEGGKTVEGTVVINNGDESFGIRVDLLSNDIQTDITDEVVTREGKKFFVKIPENDSLVMVNYTITIWPVDNPGLKDIINITVPVSDGSSSDSDDSSSDDPSSDLPWTGPTTPHTSPDTDWDLQ